MIEHTKEWRYAVVDGEGDTHYEPTFTKALDYVIENHQVLGLWCIYRETLLVSRELAVSPSS